MTALDESITAGELGHLSAHQTVHIFANGETASARKALYVRASGGSDGNDGLSWATAKATIAGAISAASGQADIYLDGGNGTHAWADTLTVAQGVRIHGKSPHANASGGTELVWSGADDGRDGLVTSASAAADWTQGLIENIRFSGSGTMSGGGTALHVRNAQNGAKLFNVRVVSWDTGIGIKVSSTISTGYPGYANFENVWVTGGTVAGWDIECPMTNLVFTNCGSDPVASHGTARSWIVRAAGFPYGAAVNKTITSSSQSGATATHIATGHGLSVGYFVDISGTSVAGYHGVFRVATVPDVDTFTVDCGAVTGLGAATGGTAFRCVNGDRGTVTFISCKAESSVADAGWLFRGSTGMVLVGCSYFEQSANGAGIAFEYLGPIHNGNGEVDPAPRVALINCISQSMEYSFSAPFHGVSILAEEGYAGGRFQNVNYVGRQTVSFIDLPQIATPQNPLTGTRRIFVDVATGKVSARTSAGATVLLEP